MTVIAWDGTTLASDRRMTSGHTISTTKKIFRVKDGIIGFAGNAAAINEFLAWFQTDRTAYTFPEYLTHEDCGICAMFINNQRQIFNFEFGPSPYLVTQKRAAIGSGDESALVAMECGKNAAEAVKIVSKFNASCGNGVDVLTLN